MALPDSYTLKPGAIPAYFGAMLDAQPPERFSVRFLEHLGFTSTNDRLMIGILKDLGFLNRDSAPTSRYFQFLDRSRSAQTVAEGVRDAFNDLFAINTKANEMKVEDVKNKLRTMYAGKKTDLVISNIAKTFRALCDYGDFATSKSDSEQNTVEPPAPNGDADNPPPPPPPPPPPARAEGEGAPNGQMRVSGLQYHINIVLPDTRDQAVYDAIFKSLREHLA